MKKTKGRRKNKRIEKRTKERKSERKSSKKTKHFFSFSACMRALDLGIILDGSGSVKQSNFKKALQFLSTLVSHTRVSPSGTHVGMITYNSIPTLEFTPAETNYHHLTSLKHRIGLVGYNGGWTFTDKALSLADQSLFTRRGGDRSGAQNVLIVLTDGMTSSTSVPYPEVLKPLQVGDILLGTD